MAGRPIPRRVPFFLLSGLVLLGLVLLAVRIRMTSLDPPPAATRPAPERIYLGTKELLQRGVQNDALVFRRVLKTGKNL